MPGYPQFPGCPVKTCPVTPRILSTTQKRDPKEKTSPRRKKSAPKTAPKRPQDGSKTPQDTRRRPKTPPRRLQFFFGGVLDGSWGRLGASPVRLGGVVAHCEKVQKTTGFIVFLGTWALLKTCSERLVGVLGSSWSRLGAAGGVWEMKGSTILTTLAHNLRVGRKRRGQTKPTTLPPPSLFPIYKYPLPPASTISRIATK